MPGPARSRRAALIPTLGSLLLIWAVGSHEAFANQALAEALVALAVHVPVEGPSRFSVQYMISNSATGGNTVNVKCFNAAGQRVGPVAGVDVKLGSGEQRLQTPATLGITIDPLFQGLGWCYFQGTALFSVALLAGLVAIVPGSEAPLPLTSEAAQSLASDIAAGEITMSLAMAPMWTARSGWVSVLFVLNPTTNSLVLDLALFDSAGVQLGPSISRALGAWDLDVLLLPEDFPSLTPPESGTVRIQNVTFGLPFGICGWVLGINSATGQALLYPLTLLRGSTDTIVNRATAP
jgi:hypothetical protein